MKSVIRKDFATLSFLGCYRQGTRQLVCNSIGNLLTITSGKLHSRKLNAGEWLIHYVVEFDDDNTFQTYYEGAGPADIVQSLKDSRSLTFDYEWMGGASFLICEIMHEEIRDVDGLLKARMRSIAQVHRGLMDNIHRMPEEMLPIDCDDFQFAEIEMTIHGRLITQAKNAERVAVHPRTCQGCRFWKAERDARIAKL